MSSAWTINRFDETGDTVPSKLRSDRLMAPSASVGMPSSQPYAVTNPACVTWSTVSCPTTVLPPTASGTETRSTPPPATRGFGAARVSVRWLANESMPTSETPLMSTISAAGRDV